MPANGTRWLRNTGTGDNINLIINSMNFNATLENHCNLRWNGIVGSVQILDIYFTRLLMHKFVNRLKKKPTAIHSTTSSTPMCCNAFDFLPETVDEYDVFEFCSDSSINRLTSFNAFILELNRGVCNIRQIVLRRKRSQFFTSSGQNWKLKKIVVKSCEIKIMYYVHAQWTSQIRTM